MASSSSSSSSFDSGPELKYDVFLSFRVEDTRQNFTSHLHAALRRKQIETFVDDELNREDEISPSLLRSIEASKISVIIFSKRYASFRWCLEELVKILECKRRYAQIVIPVFYHVDPSDVRRQSGVFGEAFKELEDRYKDRFQIWKIALSEAGEISGFDSNIIKPESSLVEKIIQDVLKELNNVSE